MRSIQLNISDSIYDKFMFFLNSVPKKSIEIISDSSISKKIETNHEDDKVQSELKTLHSLMNRSDNKVKANMELVINTDEMIDNGLF